MPFSANELLVDHLESGREYADLESFGDDRTLVAHTEYQQRPIDWIIDVLGVGERTLRWSVKSRFVCKSG